MNQKQVDHSIAFLIGQTHALFMSVQMLMRINPNRELILAQLGEIGQLGLANIETTTVPDATIEGFQFAVKGIREAAAADP